MKIIVEYGQSRKTIELDNDTLFTESLANNLGILMRVPSQEIFFQYFDEDFSSHGLTLSLETKF